MIMVDVRTGGEYRSGHIPGSINVSIADIDRIEEFIPDKQSRITVYCQSGVRSRFAHRRLKELGYSNAGNLGSMRNWDEALA